VAPGAAIRGARLNAIYRAQWFNPRDGTWMDVGADGQLRSSKIGVIALPAVPEATDWGLKLVFAGSIPAGAH
jgi:hypothetical protein